jgi:monovalent cation/proton antiporter MnhG/PhaG subunit
MIEVLAAVVGSALLLLGLTIATVGLYGLLRRRDLFEQLHAAGLVTGSGAILLLLASLATGEARIVTSAFLVLVFILVTAPLSAHAIALAGWSRRHHAAALDGAAMAAGGGAPGTRQDGTAVGGAASPMRVLVAHDGSPGGGVAVQLAAALRLPPGSAVRVVAVTEGDVEPLRRSEPDTVAALDDGADLAAALDAAVTLLASREVVADRTLRRGAPAAGIVEEATDFRAGLVVVGSRGLGRVRALLEGSVAAGVLDEAPCPVLVARTPSVRRILLATDGSPASDAAVEIVARWPVFEEAQVAVLCVVADVPPGAVPGGAALRETLEAGTAIADAAAQRLVAAGRSVTVRTDSGDPAARIAATAEAEAVDLVVLGSRGRTGLRRALLGSVARDVVADSAISVLVVRAAR